MKRNNNRDSAEYLDFLARAETDNILAVTSPCFELWLILHKENSVEEFILKDQTWVFENHKVSTHHTFTSKLFSDLFQMNPKHNLNFEVFKTNINLALIQERKINQNIQEFTRSIGSNIGVLIEILRSDPRQRFL